MSAHRFFLSAVLEPRDGEFVAPLSDEDLHHAVSVLRIRAGEELDLVEPGGRLVRATVAAASSQELVVRDIRVLDAPGPSIMAHVTLAFGVSKGSKNDDIVEGAVEVGVSTLMPLVTERTIAKLDAEKRADRVARWRRVARAAAKQSKRSAVPAVEDVASLADALPLLAGFDVVLVAWEDAGGDAPGVREALAAVPAGARVALVVGPEGGLTAEEARQLAAIGATLVTLGATILRAETAAVVASALVVHELGGLGNRR